MKIDTKKLVALIREVVEEEVNAHLGLNEMSGVPVEKNTNMSLKDAQTSHPAAAAKIRAFVAKNVGARLPAKEKMSFNAEKWLDDNYIFRQEGGVLFLMPKDSTKDPLGQGILKFQQGAASWIKSESVKKDEGRWVKVDVITETRLNLLRETFNTAPKNKVVREVYDGDGATCMGCDRPLMDDYKDQSGVMCDDCFSGNDDQLDSVSDEFDDLRLADEEASEERRKKLPQDYESPTIDDDLEFERDLDDDLDESVIREGDEGLREPGKCDKCGTAFNIENITGPRGAPSARARTPGNPNVCYLCHLKNAPKDDEYAPRSFASSMGRNARGVAPAPAAAAGLDPRKRKA